MNYGLNDAELPGQGAKLKEGTYKVRLRKLVFKPSQRVRGTNVFIAEFEVLESSVVSIEVGSNRSWTCFMSHPNAPGNLKAFFAAAVGLDPHVPEEVKAAKYYNGQNINWDALMGAALEAANPLAGRELYVECREIITEKEKRPFMIHDWSPGEQGRFAWLAPS